MKPQLICRLEWSAWSNGLAYLLLLASVCGCHSRPFGVNEDYDIAPGALPSPLGTAVRQVHAEQVGRARLANFVINNNEWYKGGEKLGPEGRRHLQELEKQLTAADTNIVIAPQAELTDEDQYLEKNESRRQYVIAALTAAGILNADSRVILGYPEAEGLNGNLAPLAYRRMLIQGGNAGGGGGGGGLGGGGGGGLGGGMGGAMGGGGGLY
jgi:hypothetical protein